MKLNNILDFDSEEIILIPFDIEMLKKLSYEEIQNIKDFTTADELKNIDIYKFNARGNNVYDQLTGSRNKRRAFNLSLSCGIEFSSAIGTFIPPLANYKIEGKTEYVIRYNYTALEIYLDQFNKEIQEQEYKLCQILTDMRNVLTEPIIF